jgi:hypothetical protein
MFEFSYDEIDLQRRFRLLGLQIRHHDVRENISKVFYL